MRVWKFFCEYGFSRPCEYENMSCEFHFQENHASMEVPMSCEYGFLYPCEYGLHSLCEYRFNIYASMELWQASCEYQGGVRLASLKLASMGTALFLASLVPAPRDFPSPCEYGTATNASEFLFQIHIMRVLYHI